MFVPHRRGQGRSPGPYIQDQLAQARGPDEVGRRLVELHELQLSDQLAALAYLRALSFVDPGQVVVAGCSYGGIQALLGGEANVGYRAVVDNSGGALSWDQLPALRERMVRAVAGITVPTIVFQAENGGSVGPTNVLGAELERLGKPYKAQIYPPYGTTVDEGHGGFCEHGQDVWGEDILAFVKAALQP